jgi:hypothetical protein
MARWKRPFLTGVAGALIGVIIVAIWYYSSVFPYDTMGYGVLGAIGYGFWAALIGGFIGILTGWPR